MAITRTVLAGKGFACAASLRMRPCLLRAVPQMPLRDGRLRREQKKEGKSTKKDVDRLAFSWKAPAVFSHDPLQRFLVQAQIGHQLLQPPVLILQTLQPLCLTDIHPAVLRLPGVDGPFADA